MQKIIIIGSAFPLRGGGISTFNERLALEFQQQGNEVSIFSFSLQYPSIFFPGKSQYSDGKAPADLKIHSVINSINPLNWIWVGNQIVKKNPDLVIIRYWIPFMAPCLGSIARIIRRKSNAKVICIADNIIPHEKRFADRLLTKYFIKPIQGFITMSNKVTADLLSFDKHLKFKQAVHPLYDNFGKIIDKLTAREYLNIPVHDKLILFFGFIREYKGLDLLIEAMSNPKIRAQHIQLMVAGEFYQNKQPYLEKIKEFGIESSVNIIDQFISNDLVKYYCCAADVLVQPYKMATQSGVTPLAYHFEIPMIVTNVGGLPEMVADKKSGLVCDPNPTSIASHILEFFETDESVFKNGIRTEKMKYSWKTFTEKVFALYNEM